MKDKGKFIIEFLERRDEVGKFIRLYYSKNPANDIVIYYEDNIEIRQHLKHRKKTSENILDFVFIFMGYFNDLYIKGADMLSLIHPSESEVYNYVSIKYKWKTSNLDLGVSLWEKIYKLYHISNAHVINTMECIEELELIATFEKQFYKDINEV